MELIQLLYFKEVAKYENMTLAAKKNHISQQALSKSVRKLELELGTQLFDRNNNRLTLNASGRLAIEQINSILMDIEYLKKSVRRSASSRELVIGSSSLASVRSLILDFNNAYSSFFISAKSIPEDQLLDELLQKQIDAAFSCRQYTSDSSVHTLPVFQETLMLAIPLKHPLAEKESICLQDLTNQNVLGLKTCELYLNRILQELCKKNHIKTNFIWQNDYMIFDGLCDNDQYLFLTSTRHTNLLHDNRSARPFEDPLLTSTIYLHHLTGNIHAEIFSSWIKHMYM